MSYVILACLVLCTAFSPASAAPSIRFEVAAGPATETLRVLSGQLGEAERLLYSIDEVEGVETKEVRGSFTALRALQHMLKGSKLIVVEDRKADALIVRRRSPPPATATSSNSDPTQPDPMFRKNPLAYLGGILALVLGTSEAAESPDQSTASQTGGAEEEVIRLTPFEVSTQQDTGYHATSTLAGNRLRTKIEDVGSAISVYTKEFLTDIAATDNQSLLAFGVSTEVGGPRGNYIGADGFGLENENLNRPNNNTRIRGLSAADNTRNFYRSDASWDGYNIERVEVQRGANSILFGIGSPGGIINASPVEARLRKNAGHVQARFDQFGSFRTNLDYNYVVAPDQLAVRVALLNDNKKFRQHPAFEDDQRGFVTATWAPKRFNQGDTTLRLKGNYEHGRTRSNRPRMVVPIDALTAFFAAPGTSGFEGEFANAGNWGLGGQPVNQIDEAARIANPWIGSVFEGTSPRFLIGGGISEPSMVIERWANSRGAWMPITQGGTIVDVVRNDGTRTATGGVGIGAVPNNVRGTMQRPMWAKNRAAAEARLPFQGLWKDSSFTDTRHYDFFNNLIDGQTKREARDWDTFELDLAHTFLNNKLGYNVSYFNEKSDEKFYAIMGSVFAPTITVDLGALDRQATPDDRIPNPGAGQAFSVMEFGHLGSSETEREREAKRLQAFASLDAGDFGDSKWLRLLGVHDFVALAQNQTFEQYGRSIQSGNWMPEFYLARNNQNAFYQNPPPGARVADLSRLGGVNIEGAQGDVYFVPSGPNLTGLQPVPNLRIPSGSFNVRGFDATPLPGFTREAALQPWVNPTNNETSVQANNPDNYVGWSDLGSYRFVSIYDGEAEREYLTRGRSVFSEDIDSIAGVWTGRLWDGNLVGMYGWRQDKVEETFLSHNYTAASDGGIFDPDRSNRTIRSTEVQSNNWSAKINLTGALQQSTGIGGQLPFDLHLLYSEGEVQTPDPTRVDLFGRTLANSVGSTRDASAMIVGKSGNWSFRVTKYETDVRNTASTATLNREVWRLLQVLEQGAFASGNIELDKSDYTASWLPLSPRAAAAGFTSEAEFRRQVVAPAFREMERTLYEDFPLSRAWYRRGSYSGNFPFTPGQTERPQVSFPDGAVLVEDQISEGWEVELTASPRRNWNLAINASRSVAIRDNVPGTELGSVFDYMGEMMQGPAGDLRMWWAQGVRFQDWINPLLGELATARALNGAAQPEIRKWRANLISRYVIENGPIRGVGLGGAYRYEDSQIVGFLPTQDPVTGAVGVDTSTAFRDDARHTFDLWLTYERQLTRKVGWTIQLNVHNAFGRNEVVPLHRNPDGSFGQMGIRDGRSWSITNTFTF